MWKPCRALFLSSFRPRKYRKNSRERCLWKSLHFIFQFRKCSICWAAADAVKLTSHKQSHNVIHFYIVFVRQLSSFFHFFHPLLRHSAVVKLVVMTWKHVKIAKGKKLFIVHKINNNNYTLHLVNDRSTPRNVVVGWWWCNSLKVWTRCLRGDFLEQTFFVLCSRLPSSNENGRWKLKDS